MTRKSRKFRGYAVLERPDGPIVWGTFRPSRQEAAAIWKKWNPGHEAPAHVVQAEIRIFDFVKPVDL